MTHPFPDIWQRLRALVDAAPTPPGEQRLIGAIQHAQAEPELTASGAIGVSSRFADAVRGEGATDAVRLRAGSGRTYAGYRSSTCPGDGVVGHQHDVRCVAVPGAVQLPDFVAQDCWLAEECLRDPRCNTACSTELA